MKKLIEINNIPGAFLHIIQMKVYYMQGITPWHYHTENPFELMKYLDRVESAKNEL